MQNSNSERRSVTTAGKHRSDPTSTCFLQQPLRVLSVFLRCLLLRTKVPDDDGSLGVHTHNPDSHSPRDRRHLFASRAIDRLLSYPLHLDRFLPTSSWDSDLFGDGSEEMAGMEA